MFDVRDSIQIGLRLQEPMGEHGTILCFSNRFSMYIVLEWLNTLEVLTRPADFILIN